MDQGLASNFKNEKDSLNHKSADTLCFIDLSFFPPAEFRACFVKKQGYQKNPVRQAVFENREDPIVNYIKEIQIIKCTPSVSEVDKDP